LVSSAATVKEFADWWMDQKPFDPPRQPMCFLPNIAGVTLYSKSPFQVQLFISAPGLNIPSHAHPNVDVLNVTISIPKAFRQKSEVSVPPGTVHELHTMKRGGSYLSFQKWLNDVPIKSLNLDWIGEPMDENHAVELAGAR
jgi:hypothetical protein